MPDFKDFIESNDTDAKVSIRKLPASHRNLVRGFSVKFVSTGTIPGDNQHIGKVQDKPNKSITVAAPWFYSREFVLTHEISHLVWAKYVKGTKLEEQWKKIVARTKNKAKENAEELFCHSYANYYCKHQVVKHQHKEWEEFIRTLPK